MTKALMVAIEEYKADAEVKLFGEILDNKIDE
jgi:hypothetical protein